MVIEVLLRMNSQIIPVYIFLWAHLALKLLYSQVASFMLYTMCTALESFLAISADKTWCSVRVLVFVEKAVEHKPFSTHETPESGLLYMLCHTMVSQTSGFCEGCAAILTLVLQQALMTFHVRYKVLFGSQFFSTLWTVKMLYALFMKLHVMFGFDVAVKLQSALEH